MAEEKIENPKMQGDNEEEIISLSDSELDNILNSAELTDSPIEDLKINFDEEPVAAIQPEQMNDTSTDVISTEDLNVQEETPETIETQVPASTEETEKGFFDDEDETIGLSSNELDNILEKASSTFENEQSQEPKEDFNQQLEAPVLGGSDITMEDDSLKSSPFNEQPSPKIEVQDEELPLIDESELVFDEEDRLILEDADTAVSSEMNVEEEPAAVAETPILEEMADEDILLDEEPSIESEKQASPQPVDSGQEVSSTEPQIITPESEDNVLSVSGESVDQVIGDEGQDDILSDFQVSEGIVLEEPVELEIKDEDVQSSEISMEQEEFQPIDDNLLIEEESITLDDSLDTKETAATVQEPEQTLESEEVVIEETMVNVPAAEEEYLSESAQTEPMAEEIIIEEPVAVPPSMEETISEEPADIEIVSEDQIEDETPEIIEEEIIFEEEEKIEAEPHDTTGEIPVETDINELDISEMKDEIISQPESIPESGFDNAPMSAGIVAENAAPQKENFEGLTENTKEDVKEVLSYLDGLFDNLPEDKIKEFAESKYYNIYNKLFNELGI